MSTSERKLILQPITFREACVFINRHHRHHKSPQGHFFSVAVSCEDRIVGVAMIGHPVAAAFTDGWTAEVTRCCTDGTPHVASKLYAAARRACFALGYKRLITYTLAEESGTSLRAAGWKEIGRAGGGSWHRANRPRVKEDHPTGTKTLWEFLADVS